MPELAQKKDNYKQSGISLHHQNVAAVLLYSEAQLFKFSKTNLDVTAALLPALSDPGRVCFNTNTSYYIKVVSNLK